MERIKALEEYIREYWDERTRVKRESLAEYDAKLEKMFRMKLGILIDEQVKRQSEEGQSKIRYLFLCKLMSSSYVGSYEAVLGMSSSMLYLDENKSQVYWCPTSIYEDINEDMKEVEKRLRKQFIRLKDHELFWLKQKLLNEEWGLVCESFQRLIEKFADLILNSPLQLEDNLLVLCGDYMDQLQIVWCIEAEKREWDER